MIKKAIVLSSGGLDSTTCLAIARSEGFECYTLAFDYGQKHHVELDAASFISKHYGAKHHQVFKLPNIQFMGSSLTDEQLAIPNFEDQPKIPTTYVPARNTVFLSMALGYAEVVGAYDIFIGISSVDYSHYPDCRPEYLEQFQKMADLATKSSVEGQKVKIHAPLLYLSKAATIARGIALGVDYRHTISCYRANNKNQACGECASCTLRKKGFQEAGIEDPTYY